MTERSPRVEGAPDPRGAPQDGPRGERGARGGAGAGLVAALATAPLGVPLGLVWAASAPREEVQVSPGGRVVFLDAGGDLFVGADLLFVLVAAVLGLLAGGVAHRRGASRGWPVVVGLALGGVVAALLGVRIGEALGTGALVYEDGLLSPADGRPLPPEVSGTVQVALTLRATAAVVVLPLVAVLAHLCLQLARPGPPEPGEGRRPWAPGDPLS